MLAHKHLSRLAGYSNAETFSVMQSKRNLLRTGVYIGNCRFYGLADAARAILLRRLRALDIREAVAVTMIDQLPVGALELATEAFESGDDTALVVTFTRADTGVTAAVNAAPPPGAGTTLKFDLADELREALDTEEPTE